MSTTIGQSQPTAQHLCFRPPEQQPPPPAWCTGLRAGHLPGGGWPAPNVFAQRWLDFADPDDAFVVRLCAEDVIVGDEVRRCATRLEVSDENQLSRYSVGAEDGCSTDRGSRID